MPSASAVSFARTAGLQRSEEHTSELQSRLHLVCRLLLEKKKKHIQCDARLLHAHRARVLPRRVGRLAVAMHLRSVSVAVVVVPARILLDRVADAVMTPVV